MKRKRIIQYFVRVIVATLIIFFEDEQKIPVQFLGHGSPMNTIEENEFVTGFRDIATTKTKTQSGPLRVDTLGNQ